MNLEIIAISIYEPPGAVEAWHDTNPMPFPVLVDQYGEVYSQFASGPFPFNVVIDGDHVLRYHAPYYNLSEITGWIDTILDEAPATESTWSELRTIY